MSSDRSLGVCRSGSFGASSFPSFLPFPIIQPPSHPSTHTHSLIHSLPLPLISHRLSSTRATIIALLCTTSEICDVPVYWPILVCYFFVLFALTMRRQIHEFPLLLLFCVLFLLRWGWIWFSFCIIVSSPDVVLIFYPFLHRNTEHNANEFLHQKQTYDQI